MEAIRRIADTALNEPTKTLSQNQQNSTKTIPREQHLALFSVINKVRMLNGWTTKTAKELDATIRTWAEAFDRKRIPFQHYDELYKRAFEVRVNQMQRDGRAETIDAPSLAACWPGLAQDLDREMVASGRYLGETAVSDCPRCFGAGMEVVPGKGARACKHELVETEDRSPNPEAAGAVLDAIRSAHRDEPERPKPRSAIGILNEAILQGGHRETLDHAIAYVRAMRDRVLADNEALEQMASAGMFDSPLDEFEPGPPQR